MASKVTRPGAVTGAAIILVIFSALQLLGGICGVLNPVFQKAIQAAMPQQPGGNAAVDMQEQLAKEIPSYQAVQMGQAIVNMLLGVTGIIASIGLFKLRPVARVTAMTLCVAIMVIAAANVVYSFVFVMPAANRLMTEQFKKVDQELKQMQGQGNPNAPQINFSAFGGIAESCMGGLTIFGLIFNLALYLTVFFLLNSKKSRDAFAGKFVTEPQADPEDRPRGQSGGYTGYEDDDDSPRLPPETGITDRPPS